MHPSIDLHIDPSINPSWYWLIDLSVQLSYFDPAPIDSLITSSIHPSIHQPMDHSHQRIDPSMHLVIDSSTYWPLSHSLINSSTHQLIDLSNSSGYSAGQVRCTSFRQKLLPELKYYHLKIHTVRIGWHFHGEEARHRGTLINRKVQFKTYHIEL